MLGDTCIIGSKSMIFNFINTSLSSVAHKYTPGMSLTAMSYFISESMTAKGTTDLVFTMGDVASTLSYSFVVVYCQHMCVL